LPGDATVGHSANTCPAFVDMDHAGRNEGEPHATTVPEDGPRSRHAKRATTRAECRQVKRSTKHGEAEATPNAAPAANPAQ
jgi:hypothetical protein